MMGESSVCSRSYSQPSPTSTEENKGNALQQALTSSVSLGRFMSESLDWERWSAFNHNRYLEEVEKFSRPGSVAEKKAYFEAHFKRRRAAKMLEQQNAASNAAASDDLSEANTGNSFKDCSSLDSDMEQKESPAVAKDMNVQGLQTSYLVPPVEQISSYNALTETKSVENEGVQDFMANTVGLENHIENDERLNENLSKIEDKGCNKDDSSPARALPSSSSEEIKPEIPSKLLPNANASLEKHIVLPLQVENSDKIPRIRSGAKESSNKRRSYETSLHMPNNFASCSGKSETQTVSLPKIEKSKLIRAPAKKYKNSKIQTSSQASGNGLFKHYKAISLPENRRSVKPYDRLISQSNGIDGKMQSPFSNKARLPTTVPSTFVFRSEERAAKRREMLEQKQKSEMTAGEQQQKKHVKSEVIAARNKCKDLANSAGEVAAPTELSNLKKKIPTLRPSLPKIEERATASFKVDDKSHSRPPWKLSVKTQTLNDLTGKINHHRTRWLSRNENASPNIRP